MFSSSWLIVAVAVLVAVAADKNGNKRSNDEMDLIKAIRRAMLRVETRATEEELFASEVLEYSSEWDTTDWGVSQLLGAPDVYNETSYDKGYEDDVCAWAPLHATTTDYVVVRFEKAICISAVDIYETHSGGSVTKILAHRHSDVPYESETDHQWDVLFSRRAMPTVDDVISDKAEIFSPSFDKLQYMTSVVKFYVYGQPTWSDDDYTNWVEIDAIAIRGDTDCPDSPEPSGGSKRRAAAKRLSRL